MKPAGTAIRDWRPGDRPRERLGTLGAAGLSVRELLAIVVGSGGAGRSAMDIADGVLVAAGGSLRRLGTLAPSALRGVPGVGNATAARILAAIELGRRAAVEGPRSRDPVRGPGDVFRRVGPAVRDLRHEEFRALLLDTRHTVLREVVVTRGILDASLIHPREVFRPAIVESAAAVILAHNHPSGDPTPSPEDRAVTRQLAEAGRAVGIAVLDHVILGDGRFVSLAEEGLLATP